MELLDWLKDIFWWSSFFWETLSTRKRWDPDLHQLFFLKWKFLFGLLLWAGYGNAPIMLPRVGSSSSKIYSPFKPLISSTASVYFPSQGFRGSYRPLLGFHIKTLVWRSWSWIFSWGLWVMKLGWWGVVFLCTNCRLLLVSGWCVWVSAMKSLVIISLHVMGGH